MSLASASASLASLAACSHVSNLEASRRRRSAAASRSRCTCASLSDSVPEAQPAAAAGASSIRIRKAVWPDVKSVAQVCASAFADVPGKIPKGPKSIEGLDDYFISKYSDITAREILKAMSVALQKKEECTLTVRAARAARRADVMRAEVALMKYRVAAGNADVDDAEGLNERIESALAADTRPLFPQLERERLQRQRQWMCLVAEDTQTSIIIGCAFLSWMVPDASLPPPFPTSRPQKLYVSNMGVDRQHRRRGIARALLSQCERLALRWGQPEVFLHVDVGNDTAESMYAALGYSKIAEDPWWVAEKRRLLRKQLRG